jgi:hypothetical protein
VLPIAMLIWMQQVTDMLNDMIEAP